MDKLKKLQDLVNLEKEPSLVLYEKLEQLTDTIQGIGAEVKESREILLDKKKLKELLTPVYGVDYLTETDIDRISAEILAKATPVKGIDYKDGDKGDKGEDGKNGLNGINGLDGLDGENGKDGKDGINGKDGKDGKDGETPDHEWLGTKLRFKKANGDWGRWVDLKGKDGKGVSIFGGGGVSLPNTAGNAGKVLAVKTDGINLEWKTDTVNDLTDYDIQNQFKVGTGSSYMEITTTGTDGPTLVEYWDTSLKGTKLYTKAITYTGGDPTKVVVTDLLSGKVMTTDIVYVAGEFSNKTITIS